MCNGAGCGGSGHRRQLQLSHWTHGDGPTCDWDTFDTKADAMDALCCPGGDCGATNGVPEECGLDCAVLFANMYNTCHDTLSSVVGQSMPLFDHFVERCYQLVSAHEIDILGALGAAACPDDSVEPSNGVAEGGDVGSHTACTYTPQSCMAVPMKTAAGQRFQYRGKTVAQCEALCKCVCTPHPVQSRQYFRIAYNCARVLCVCSVCALCVLCVCSVCALCLPTVGKNSAADSCGVPSARVPPQLPALFHWARAKWYSRHRILPWAR